VSPRLSSFLIRSIGILLLVIAASVATFKAPDRPLESLVARWAAPPSQFVELKVKGEVQLTHLRDEGPREDSLPILLLHGTSDSLHTWDGWTRELSKTRRVVRVDLPGFGLTGPSPSEDYGIEAYVAFIQALLDDLKLPRVLIAGNSLGGEVAWMTAARHPSRVAGLVLIDPSGLPFEPEHLPMGFAASAFAPSAWLSRFLLPRPLVRNSVEAVFGNPAKVSNAEVDRFFEISLREGNRHALHQRIQALLAEAPSGMHAKAWPLVKAPTLLLWGEKDRLIPPRFGQQYLDGRGADAAPASLKLLPGLGHVPQLEDPRASLDAARPFMDALK
jgi:pimeloyl-ACP methyl ester carboxylesterase